MRITKKFAGASCIGKQVFQPADTVNDGYNRELEELEALRVIFYRRVCDRTGSIPTASSSSSGPSSRKYSLTPEDALDGDTSSAASSFSTTNSNPRLSVKFMREDRDGDVTSSRHRSSDKDGNIRSRLTSQSLPFDHGLSSSSLLGLSLVQESLQA